MVIIANVISVICQYNWAREYVTFWWIVHISISFEIGCWICCVDGWWIYFFLHDYSYSDINYYVCASEWVSKRVCVCCLPVDGFCMHIIINALGIFNQTISIFNFILSNYLFFSFIVCVRAGARARSCVYRCSISHHICKNTPLHFAHIASFCLRNNLRFRCALYAPAFQASSMATFISF